MRRRPAVDTAPAGAADNTLVLHASDVRVDYAGVQPTHAVRGVSLQLRRGEVLGIAGESGCGKSTLAAALTRTLRPPAELTRGTIEFQEPDGRVVDLMALDPAELRAFRWNRIGIVFQSAMNALNPVTTLRRQFADIFRTHRPDMNARARDERARELLDMVDIPSLRLNAFPYELSGGMRQRVVIAMALALNPDIIVMDEPTTALDVVVQREILDEIQRLREELGFSIVFITHDLSLLLEISDRLAVMYAGRIVEHAPATELRTMAAHPYTRALLRSFPDLRGQRRDLHGIPGTPPDLRETRPGCPFAPRCVYAFEPCGSVTPSEQPPAGTTRAAASSAATNPWYVACHLHDPAYRSQLPAEANLLLTTEPNAEQSSCDQEQRA
jgi:peptide/nickel transport system ATP-binding protein